MPDSVLVPLDGSAAAESSLPWATALASRLGLNLVLFRAIPWPLGLASAGMDGYATPEVFEMVEATEREAAETYLDQVRAQLAGRGFEIQTLTRDGSPADRLLDLADELDPFAIVMATHGRGGLTRLAVGSVAEQILQRATVPVLLVRTGSSSAAATPRLERLLVPLDGSPLAEAGLQVARELAPGAETLFLMQAVAQIELPPASDEIAGPALDQRATEHSRAEAQGYLEQLKQDYETREVSIRTIVRIGNAPDQIVAVASEQRVDLIVMATHGRTGPARWLLGSVADRVIRQAEQPVFLVSARTLAARVVGTFTVGDAMTRDLETIGEGEPLLAVLRKLLRRRVSGAPVVNSAGVLVGVVSERDLLEWQTRLIETLTRESAFDRSEFARRLESTRVDEVMSRPAVTIDEAAPLHEAARIFLDRRLRRLPVTRSGQLIGILTRADLLKAMADRWQATSPSGTPPSATA